MAALQATSTLAAPAVLNQNQITKAALSLIRHLDKSRDITKVDKPGLLDDDDEENKKSHLDVPLWLVMTAKERIATSHTLIPAKIIAPNPLYSSPETRVCLITADPPASNPRAYKDLKDNEKFPKDLKPKIRKIIQYSRVAKKYKSYESRRQFLAEYDVFLADDRIIHLLPVALGSVFYKSTTKRPIAVSLSGKERWGKKQKKSALDRLKPKRKGAANDGPALIGKPEDVGHDIETALSTLVVNLSPSTSISIKVAYAGWPAEWITANVCAAVERVVTKYIPEQWDGLKALHLKGPNTAALPLFMAETIWDEDRVLDEGEKAGSQNFAKKKRKIDKGKGRLIGTEVAAQIEGENSKKRKPKDLNEGTNRSKRTKVVVLEPLEEDDPEEAKKKRDAHQKLIDEVARKMKEADKRNEVTKKLLQEDERHRKEEREKHPEHVPFTITNPINPPSPRLKFDVENWQWEE